ncbi:TIGR01906 family membrane protein [Limosilactobacillus antri]|uniref:TIGR01906 family membrane protein n=1 Tax=Limosilactobacillus antri TaxID=227943 RepID=UPI001F56C474|nr:TIGR01906 family membrane protein [Limosilactobacillus antri]
MTGRLTNPRAILITLVCIVSVLSLALFITLNVSPWVIVHSRAIQVSWVAINADYRRLLVYLELPLPGQLKLAHLPLTAAARSHFADVKLDLLLNELLMVTSTPVAWLSLRKEKRRQQLWQLLTPLMWGMSLLAVTLVLVLVDFPSVFISSHYWLFSGMNWVMNPQTDPIILLMPLSFFTKLFMIWTGLVFFFLTILWGYLRFASGLAKFRL